MTKHNRFPFQSTALATVLALLTATSLAVAQTGAEAKKGASDVPGQRVFTAGHSFHYFMPPILSEIAQAAGIQDHQAVGLSAIGGSAVIRHWNPNRKTGKSKAQEALRTGKVDVLTLSPLLVPDEGIEKFASLALEHNPEVRVTVQENWMPYDTFYEVYPPEVRPETDHNAATGEQLRKIHAPSFKSLDDHIVRLNEQYGKQVLFAVPVGHAVVALREKIIAGEAPGLKEQKDLFRDHLGHGHAPIQVLVTYCHFAVIYKRTPVGLPVPSILERYRKGGNPELEKLNHLLQELAWEAVTQHPLSGVKAPASN